LSAGQDARLYGRPEARHYGGSAGMRALFHCDRNEFFETRLHSG